ncbi:MAG: hypothetical protein H6815_02380 [Phycisphaeraceae bacterium]|nr:hypothetical protein [Phycisphaerales bacterium]MCB9859274.1 hypothetical protein [Phycisphaeraceae bacterium]
MGIIAVSFIATTRWMYQGLTVRYWDRYTHLLLVDAVCPMCLYSIAGQHTDEHNLLCCPECGHYWHSDHVLRRPVYTQGEYDGTKTFRAYTPGEIGTSVQHDDRNRRVPDGGGVFFLAASAETDADKKQRLENVIREARTSTRGKRWILAGGMVAMAAMMLPSVGLFQPIPTRLSMHLAIRICSLSTFFSMCYFAWRMARSSFSAKTSDAALARRICPACADFLDEIEPESDGCTVCQTCGAAWRV